MSRCGVRRLVAFIEGLPDDSALARERNQGWTLQSELAATGIEMTDLWGRIVAITLGQPVEKLPRLPQITHPGRTTAEPARPPVTTDPAAIHSFFNRR